MALQLWMVIFGVMTSCEVGNNVSEESNAALKMEVVRSSEMLVPFVSPHRVKIQIKYNYRRRNSG